MTNPYFRSIAVCDLPDHKIEELEKIKTVIESFTPNMIIKNELKKYKISMFKYYQTIIYFNMNPKQYSGGSGRKSHPIEFNFIPSIRTEDSGISQSRDNKKNDEFDISSLVHQPRIKNNKKVNKYM